MALDISEIRKQIKKDQRKVVEDHTKPLRNQAAKLREEIASRQQKLEEIQDAISKLQGGPGRGRRRSSSGKVDDGAILDFIREQDGPVGAGAIAKAVGVEASKLSPHLKRLVDEGKLSKTGERRGTVYTAD